MSDFIIGGQPVLFGNDALTDDLNLYDPETNAVVGTLDVSDPLGLWHFRGLSGQRVPTRFALRVYSGQRVPTRFALRVYAVMDQSDYQKYYEQLRRDVGQGKVGLKRAQESSP